MKQLFATCPVPRPADAPQTDADRPLNGRPQPARVAARGASVAPAEAQAAADLAGYALPPGRPPESDESLPIRLALLQTAETGRTLAHVAPGPDGVAFAHVLFPVPLTTDAGLAVQTWDSPLWLRAEPEGAELPDLPYLPVGEVLDDAGLKKWLGTPAHRDLLEWGLTALLSTDGGVRLFVAAPPLDVAWLLYGVTRALPSNLLDDLTFSTFEADPLARTARVIGCDTGAPDWDLPGNCYADAGLAFNLRTGRKSELPTAAPFAAFAAESLGASDLAALDELKGTWQRLGLGGPRQFDLVYRLARGAGVLTKEETAEALKHPPLTAWVAARQDALNQFLEWALGDREFAAASYSRVVQALRQKPDLLAKQGQAVRDQGLKAVREGDVPRAANALEVVLPLVAPAKATAVWGELLQTISDPAALSWPMRGYLLPRLVRFKQPGAGGNAVDPAFQKWLDVPTEQLAETLALELPRPYHFAAASQALARSDEPTPLLAQTLAGHMGLTMTLLQPTAADAAGTKSVALFEQLIGEAPGQPWFEEVVGQASQYPPALLNRFLESALTAGKIDPDRVVRLQGPRLLELFAGQSGLDRVGRQFFVHPPQDLLHNPGLLKFLEQLRAEPQVSDDVRGQIDHVRAAKAYLETPGFDPAAMAAAAAGLAHVPPSLPPSAKGDLFAAVSRQLLQRGESESLQTDLEAALVAFGSTLAEDPTDLYENLLRDVRGRADLGRSPNTVHAFLAVALGAAKHPDLAGKLDGLDGHAFAVASDAAKRGGQRLLDDLEGRSADWPRPARVQWGFLKAAVTPPKSRVFRDIACVLIGAALASAAWAATRFGG